jgi:hypothetical protein
VAIDLAATVVAPPHSLFVSLVYYAEGTVRWFVVREKHY